ncbi:MAG: DNA mismatch repair endonuclease MutL, partial [Clostridiales bacterium]|nr:DNA mismatch repair endonuclease MutL [Clostridiales bacterium]
MAKIQVLDKAVSELIAAGEVIERPSSVIKELIENSIDAGSTSITIEIRNGGISYMRVTDNGNGIARDDLPTAFLRHATSKISAQDDLHNISTLGFRGEALASVSAVARVEITSKRKDEQFGARYVIEGAEGIELENAGCPDGTTIVIRDLFYNTPARLKFLKKTTTESNYVAALVDKIALSHPEVSFRMIRDGKQTLTTTGNGDLLSAIYSVFGNSFASTLIPVTYEYENIKIEGYTCTPLQSRANRSMQNFFVNGRFVKAPVMTSAIEAAYKDTIMVNRFPACVLNIEINPSLIDINVHPAKTEVRFVTDKHIFDCIFFGIKSALIKNDTVRRVEASKFVKADDEFQATEAKRPQASYSSIVASDVKTNLQTPSMLYSQVTEYKTSKKPQENVAPERDIPKEFKYINNESFRKKEGIIEEEENLTIEGTIDNIEVNIIGELFKTYVIAQVEEDVIVVDKHAAHERLLYERIKKDKQIGNGQILLSPIEITLTKDEFDAIVDNEEIVRQMGFGFSISSNGKIKVSEVPTTLTKGDCELILSEIASNIIASKD